MEHVLVKEFTKFCPKNQVTITIHTNTNSQ